MNILRYLEQNNPDFWKYKVGDEVIFEDWYRPKKGVVEQLRVDLDCDTVIPCYSIRYGDGISDYTYKTKEREMTKNASTFKRYKQLKKELDEADDRYKALREEMKKLLK